MQTTQTHTRTVYLNHPLNALRVPSCVFITVTNGSPHTHRPRCLAVVGAIAWECVGALGEYGVYGVQHFIYSLERLCVKRMRINVHHGRNQVNVPPSGKAHAVTHRRARRCGDFSRPPFGCWGRVCGVRLTHRPIYKLVIIQAMHAAVLFGWPVARRKLQSRCAHPSVCSWNAHCG